ncbi:FAD dependent oxidoreductase, putative [Synechococcus sp. PCC 7335]|uniref:N-methyl-L-tryptophan oxidase n=1 Tax=Synechococcus sp. (strain ATCC 29403 / PCC 7335) TaxID=91464 RepID=UPI00017ED5E6|nr:N-methyl-L-tryptophan oxidase [Synechococcus sp. PCC 7335]EDX87896.1 FAD dependent oxidoreductase, putative [Synechococcus sp. PCC 7335]
MAYRLSTRCFIVRSERASSALKSHFDYIVLGCGGIGSAALYWLSKRAGTSVLGIEQFSLFHPNGGSQDYSRIIRLAYHQEKYARLTPYAYKAWDTIAKESGVAPVTKTGGVQIAYKDRPYRQIVEDYAIAMDAAGIEYERWDNVQLRDRFPQFQPQGEIVALYQSQTGIVDPARGNAVHISLARSTGATVLENCPVISLQPGDSGEGVLVKTEQGAFTCDRLVVAAGAWTSKLLESVGMQLPLKVTQEQVSYYSTLNLKAFSIGEFPVFQWKDDFSYYGFPVYGEVATKAAIDASGHTVTTKTRDFMPNPQREQQLRDFLTTQIPGFTGPTLYSKTCLYAMPPDRDFILDALPKYPQIFAAVGAGHAYKFASLLGKILSELAIDGVSQHNISPFSFNRPALVEQDFVPSLRV